MGGDDVLVATIVITVVITLIVFALIFKLEWRYMRVVSAPAVVRRLRRSPNGEFTTEIRGLGWAWDPAPGSARAVNHGRLSGPGRVTYTQTTDDLIHVTLVGRDGRRHQSEGPVPRVLVAGTPEASRTRRVRRILRFALAFYPFCGAVGFAVGYTVVSARDRSAHLEHGVVGFFVGFLGVAVLLHIIVVIVGASGIGTPRRMGSSSEGAHPSK